MGGLDPALTRSFATSLHTGVLLIRLAGIFSVLATAQTVAQPIGSPPAYPVFDTRSDSRFGDAKIVIQTYLSALSVAKRKKNHVCIVGYTLGDGTRQAWAHWQEGGRIILWEGSNDTEGRKDGLRHSRRDLDLDKDVVADDSAVDGSSYRVTRAWVSSVLFDCVRFGHLYKVKVR